uniref:Uncharacterized protein n=1 Tax=Pithovirus LCPAC304 TaxID=2506594 RepID=A0A481Z9B3_9VIRU|nr:MAG: uncharacterized protein LCPAC304_04320 [Pithovirus LCPAC304]
MERYGQIRVGRRKYARGGYTDPSFPGFTPVICLTKSTAYGSLSPYVITDEKGRIMENIFQYSKAYAQVPKSTQTYSRYDHRVIWDHPAEIHVKDGALTDDYWNWRNKGMNCKDAVRYPVGFKHRHKCLYALSDNNLEEKLDYINSRKEIYLPLYKECIQDLPQFLELQHRVQQGEHLLIIEVDGPHEESMSYYKDKYGVNNDFIVTNTVLVTPENMEILLNDETHPFGHGYCLGLALLQ